MKNTIKILMFVFRLPSLVELYSLLVGQALGQAISFLT